MNNVEIDVRVEALIEACKAVCHHCRYEDPHGTVELPWSAVREIKEQSRCYPIRKLIHSLRHGGDGRYRKCS